MASQLEPEEGLGVGSWQRRSLMGQLCVLSATCRRRGSSYLSPKNRSKYGMMPRTLPLGHAFIKMDAPLLTSLVSWKTVGSSQSERYMQSSTLLKSGNTICETVLSSLSTRIAHWP